MISEYPNPTESTEGLSGGAGDHTEAQRFPELDPLNKLAPEFLAEVDDQIGQRLESFGLDFKRTWSSPFGADDQYSPATRMDGHFIGEICLERFHLE